MLNLENALIDKLKPEYNRSANLSRVKLYGSNPETEDFKRLEDILVELPIRKNAGNHLYVYFEGHSFKYPYGKLNTNGKHTIPAYFIQEDNKPFDHYKTTGVNKVVKNSWGEVLKGEDDEEGISIEDTLKELGLYKYVKIDTPTWSQSTFDNKFVFTHRQWRVAGKDKWYTISDKSRFIAILQEYVDGKYGNITIDKEPIFSFGKYRNKKVSDIIAKDPNYIEWCMDNLDHFQLVKLGLKCIEDQECIYESALERLNSNSDFHIKI